MTRTFAPLHPQAGIFQILWRYQIRAACDCLNEIFLTGVFTIRRRS